MAGEGGIVFAGQQHSIGRAQTQVYGITDKRDHSIRRAQTMGVQPNSNSYSSQAAPVGPGAIELQARQHQAPIGASAVSAVNAVKAANGSNGIKVHMPVSQRRVVPLDDGTVAHNENLFKRLKGTPRKLCFALSVIVSALFTYISFIVFTSFGNTVCSDDCDFSKISDDVIINKISTHGLTVLTDSCEEAGFYLLYRYNLTGTEEEQNNLIELDLDDLNNLYEEDALQSNLYLTQTSSIDATCVTTSDKVSNGFNGYTVVSKADSNDNIWYQTDGWNGTWIAVSWVYLLFIVATEWLFWSYSTEFTKKLDNISMFMWALLRFGNHSFLFSIALAYSLLVTEHNKVAFMIGEYSNVAVQLCVITGLVGLVIPVACLILFGLCLCLAVCCAESESNSCGECGCSMREFHESCCTPCGEWFIPYSRFRSDNLVNDNEQCVGDAMCYFAVFGTVLVVAGIITFVGFVTVLFDGSYFHDGSAAALYFGVLIVGVLETIWFWTYDDGTQQNRTRAQSNPQM